jgi:hypothetical protein
VQVSEENVVMKGEAGAASGGDAGGAGQLTRF